MQLLPQQIRKELRALKGREVGVIGAGRSGLAAASLALNLGANVRVFDEVQIQNDDKDNLENLARKNAQRCAFAIDAFSVASLAVAEVLVVSPGVPLQHPVLQQLLAQDKLLVTEVDLALAQSDLPVIAITGTNGKSTVTTMIGDILAASGWHPFCGGNLGIPLSTAILDAQKYDVLVLELSSYQLELCRLLQPRVAIITNLAPDHLNRYPDLEAYYDAKRNIYRQVDSNGCVILRAQDLAAGLFADAPKAALCTYTADSDNKNLPPQVKLRIDGTRVLLRSTSDVTSTAWSKIRVDNPNVMGAHNMQNIAAAILAAQAMGVSIETLRTALSAYHGIAHRLQRVLERDGVLFVNDSKATNVDATVKALQAFERPIHLIAGGLAKGDDLRLIAQAARGRVKSLNTIGKAAKDIDLALSDVVTIRQHAETMEQALRQAVAQAQAGDVVLLSPACASFDQYKNFEQRGEVFIQAVRALAGEGA